MTPKSTQHIIRGMRQDTSNSKASKEFAFHNHNIRITAREDHTLLSITNEKMPSYINDTQGNYIGHCVLGDYLVLFIHDSSKEVPIDRIKIAHKDKLGTFTTIYEGNLKFSTNNPIEALGVYENEYVQKVYWVDGRNQPRVINITAKDNERAGWNDTSFDFVPEIKLEDSIEIECMTSSSSFAPGVIQYAFSYYNKYGQESNIFNTSQLCYLANKDRGASPEEIISDQVIKIDVLYPDTSFDFLRVYSIHRTSLDSTPTVKILRDVQLTDTTYISRSYVDLVLDKSHTYILKGEGEYNGKEFNSLYEDYSDNFDLVYHEGIRWWCSKQFIDEHLVNYVIEEYNNEDKLVKTIKIEQGTLFLDSNDSQHIYRFIGNKKINFDLDKLEDNDNIAYIKCEISGISVYDNGIRGEIIDPSVLLYTGGEHIIAGNICAKDNTLFLGNIELIRNEVIENIKNQIIIEDANTTQNIDTSDYYYCNNNKLNNLSYYTPREIYRLGLQFQYSNGKWSSPIFIGDYTLRDQDIEVKIINNTIYLPTFKIKLNSNIQEKLNKIGVIRYRALVVFPNINERRIIDSGIVCPTLFNIEDREKNNPYSQSSWFFRPIKCYNGGGFINLYNTNNEDIHSRSSTIEFRDGVSLLKPWLKGSEIQSGTDYFVDYSVLTYHSPYTEFEDIDVSKSNIKARITGVVVIESELSNLDILDSGALGSLGVHKSEVGTSNGNTYSGLFYTDYENNKPPLISNYMVYPWHRSGSLNFDNASIASNNSRAQSAILKNKKLLNFKISKITHKIRNYIDLSLSDIKKYNNNFIQIPTNDSYRNYLGEVNRIIVPEVSYGIYKNDGDKDLYFDSAQNSNDPIEITYKSTPHYVLSIGCKDPFPRNKQVLTLIDKVGKTKGKRVKELYKYYSSDPSSIQTNNLFYADIGEIICIEKSTNTTRKKLYIKINNSIGESELIGNALYYDWEPYLNKDVVLFYDGVDSSTGNDVFVVIYTDDNGELTIETNNYDDFDTKIISSIDIPNHEEDPDQDSITSFLYMVELYRDINENTIFGGSTKADIENNTWLPASKPYNINNGIFCEYGDTRYQRYDCLKTYSYSAEDKNQVMDIVSFMCETRLNMLGRYDKNIGKIENLNITPTNFNLFNPVYSQKDNFFNYRILDEDLYKRNSFSNTITWSKEKHSGEEIDTWTNITMASTLDLDGNKGEIKKLVVHNNRILAFQEKGIAEVLFNSRVQIPTSDGVPIEITNGYKVEGFRYISNGIGSKNKNSITVTPSGVYFLDSNSNSIYLLTDGLTNLSTEKGFEIWTKKVANDPSFKTFYDNANKDVYFTTKDDCLGYSEKLGEFTSFYDYYNSDSMFNIGNSFYRLYYNSKLCLDRMFEGDYTMDYSIEFITNENPYTDKVFSHIEYRADMFNMDREEYAHDYSFGNIKVSNEYQDSNTDLTFNKYGKSNLKKKFRMWRAEIPRMGKDRMRNPWLKIKLSSRKDIENHRMELHDIIVHYFE